MGSAYGLNRAGTHWNTPRTCDETLRLGASTDTHRSEVDASGLPIATKGILLAVIERSGLCRPGVFRSQVMPSSSAVGRHTRSCRAVPLDALAGDRLRDPPRATIRVAAGQRARRRSRTSTPRGAGGVEPPASAVPPSGLGARVGR